MLREPCKGGASSAKRWKGALVMLLACAWASGAFAPGAWALQVDITTPPSDPSPYPVATNEPFTFECVVIQDQGYLGAYWFRWEFGDGSVDEGADKNLTQHTYTTDGGYTARVTVRHEPDDATSATDTVSVRVTDSGASTITLIMSPEVLEADGHSTATVQATVKDASGAFVPDGSAVSFTTTWGSYPGGQGSPPQTIQATTANGLASVVLMASDTLPPGNGTYTIAAYSGAAYASAVKQANAVGSGGAIGSAYLDLLYNDPDHPMAGGTVGEGVTFRLNVVYGTPLVQFSNPRITGAEVAGHQTTYWPADDSEPATQRPDGTYLKRFKVLPPLAWEMHNGSWNINGQVDWVRPPMMGNPGDSGTAVAPSMSVNMKTMILTPVPLVTNSGKQYLLVGTGTTAYDRTIGYTLDHALPTGQVYVEGKARVRIFDLAGVLRREVTNYHLVPGSYTYTWDGNDSYGNALPEGIYPFNVIAGHLDEAIGDNYGETSEFLTIHDFSLQAEEGTVTDTVKLTVTFKLSDSKGRLPLECRVKLFDPDFTLVKDESVTPSGLDITITKELVISKTEIRIYQGTWTCLITAKDDDGIYDKGHQNKPALEKGVSFWGKILDNPYHEQKRDYYCGEACAQMWIQFKGGGPIQQVSIDKQAHDAEGETLAPDNTYTPAYTRYVDSTPTWLHSGHCWFDLGPQQTKVFVNGIERFDWTLCPSGAPTGPWTLADNTNPVYLAAALPTYITFDNPLTPQDIVTSKHTYTYLLLPDDFATVMNQTFPGKHNAYGHFSWASADAAIQSEARFIASPVAEHPSAAVVHGGAHWMLVKGCIASADPREGGSVWGVFVDDPLKLPFGSGLGESSYWSSSVWKALHFTANTVSNNGAIGMWHDVEDPPTGVVALDTQNVMAEPPTKPHGKPSSAEEVSQIASEGIRLHLLLLHEPYASALRGSRPGIALPIASLGSTFPDYYIVPYLRGNRVVAAAIVGAVSGEFHGVTYAKVPVTQFPGITPAAAKSKAATHTRKVFVDAPQLVWKFCNESTNPWNPFYSLRAVDGTAVYVRHDGTVFERLTPHAGMSGRPTEEQTRR